MRRGYWFIPKHLFGRPVDTIAAGGPHLPVWLQQKLFGALLRLLNGDPRRLGLQKPDHKLFETHPAINSMLLHHLQRRHHGQARARPYRGQDRRLHRRHQRRLRPDPPGDRIRAQGARRQRYFGEEQHPDLYLSAFSREHEGLFGVGFVETNSGAYRLFDTQAQLIASFLHDSQRGFPTAERFARMIRSDRPDLTGGLKFVDSPRHTGYVHSEAIVKYLGKVAVRMGWRTEGLPPRVTSVLREAVAS
jgi:hypothetical protein